MKQDRTLVEEEEKDRLERTCSSFAECMQKYVTIVRPGSLCECFEQARHRILCADAGILRYIESPSGLRTVSPEYAWTREHTGSVFVYSDDVVSQRNFIASLIASRISYEQRGLLLSVDELYYLLYEEGPEYAHRIQSKQLLGIYGFGLGASLPRQLPGLLHLRRGRNLVGYFGILASEFGNAEDAIRRALGVFRDDYAEVLL